MVAAREIVRDLILLALKVYLVLRNRSIAADLAR